MVILQFVGAHVLSSPFLLGNRGYRWTLRPGKISAVFEMYDSRSGVHNSRLVEQGYLLSIILTCLAHFGETV